VPYSEIEVAATLISPDSTLVDIGFCRALQSEILRRATAASGDAGTALLGAAYAMGRFIANRGSAVSGGARSQLSPGGCWQRLTGPKDNDGKPDYADCSGDSATTLIRSRVTCILSRLVWVRDFEARAPYRRYTGESPNLNVSVTSVPPSEDSKW